MSPIPHVYQKRAILYCGDCIGTLKLRAAESVDAIVTDPPYELGFMGKGWDKTGMANSPELWAEALRVLKPGGHVASFSGTRTYHRMACAIEDAGFEIRDQLAWCYGTGFPKSHDVSKGIDKAAGIEREVVGYQRATGNARGKGAAGHYANALTGVVGYEVVKDGWDKTAPATDAARQWEGWGTALKPAWEPICLARKPLSERTVAANVLRWGTGAINVDGCRVETDETITATRNVALGSSSGGVFGAANVPGVYEQKTGGRWPANLCHDGSDEVLAAFPETKSGVKSGGGYGRDSGVHGGGQRHDGTPCFGDSGSAARFFYSAKASKADRALSKHPTVKPVKLMQWLCRMLTPPNGIVLDPFAGTGTTGEAALGEGFRVILIEKEAEYQEDIKRRLLSFFSNNRSFQLLV